VKLNRMERWVVNSPLRLLMQRWEILWFQRRLPVPAGATVLEIGCGRGAGAEVLRRRLHPAALHVLDLDPAMVAMARRRLTRKSAGGVHLCVADAVRLPYGAAHFDAVYGFGFLHHVPDWQAAVSEISRVLKPGGRYYLLELYPPVYANPVVRRLLVHPTENRFHSRGLHAALRANGLTCRLRLEIKFAGLLACAVKEGVNNGSAVELFGQHHPLFCKQFDVHH
jgi:ubiquinone/menaquinone biosynthesis C-methylase UbiE